MRKLRLFLYHLFVRNWNEHLGGTRLRNRCMRKILKKCGKHISIGYGARINPSVTLGENSGIGRNCELTAQVHIGNNVMIGPDCYMITDNHNFEDATKLLIEQGYRERKPIYIEDNCWIGARVIVLPGVTIGSGSVIGAGSVVTKDIPSMSVAVGNPCKVIRKRV